MSSVVRIASALLLWLAGCAQTVAVSAPSTLPARVPVQVFPSVWVAGPSDGDDGYLLDRLAAALAQDKRREVRRIELEQLEPARKAGLIPALTAVVRLTLKLATSTRHETDVMPFQYCGMFGCATSFQSYMQTVETNTAEATLFVHDGPSAGILQSERFKASATQLETDRPDGLAIERLAQQLVAGTNVLRIREPYMLYTSSVDSAQRGVELLMRGKWSEGRAQLELAAQALGGRDKNTQARVWYDLGVARLLAPGAQGLTEQALSSAERAFVWALRLVPSDDHAHAIEHVAELRRRQRVLAAQQQAQQQNYARMPTAGSPR